MKTTKYKGYTVHSNGNIESKWKSRGFVKYYCKEGHYPQFNFSVEGKQKMGYVHRFVWEAFNGPIPKGMTIDHINGDKTDNRLSNLQLLTPSQNNSKDKQRLSKKQIDDIRYLKAYTNYSTYKIAEEVGTSQSSVMRILSNKRFAYVY